MVRLRSTLVFRRQYHWENAEGRACEHAGNVHARAWKGLQRAVPCQESQDSHQPRQCQSGKDATPGEAGEVRRDLRLLGEARTREQYRYDDDGAERLLRASPRPFLKHAGGLIIQPQRAMHRQRNGRGDTRKDRVPEALRRHGR